MPPRRLLPRGLALVIALTLTACGASAEPTVSPTPAVAVVITTPYAAYAVATPAARLYDRPGGTPGANLPRGTDLLVEAVVTGGDGQVWYRVTAADGTSGWVQAGALSLVDDQAVATATPRPTLPPLASPAPPASPTPRPLVITGSGQGLFLRAQPGQGTVIRAYPDGTAVTPLGESTTLDGRRWLKVRVPDGAAGWMAAEYLRPG